MKLWMSGPVAVVLALALFALPAGGAPAAYADDACGNDFISVPDSGPGFDFTDACLDHDVCYSEPGTEKDRKACDDAFLAAMLESCQEQQRFGRLACLSRAYTYYFGVRLGGWAFYPYL